MKKIFIISVVVLILCGLNLSAEIPKLISFQGKLYDSDGLPINDQQNITFKIYDAETGGSALWTETHLSVNVIDAIFNVELGSVTTLGLTFDRQYWLSIKVDNDSEMSPRRLLKSSPYAFRAMLADTAFIISDGGQAAGSFSIADTLVVGETVTAAAFAGDGSQISNVKVSSITGQINLADSVTGILSSSNIADSYINNYESDTIKGSLTVQGSTFNVQGSMLVGNDSFIVLESGNVGIGSANPGYKLDVEGSIRIGAGALYFPDGSSINSSGAGSAEALSNNSDGPITADVDNNGAGKITFNIAGSEKMVILNNGNIGIGTTTPTNKFEVKVPAYFSDTINAGETVSALTEVSIKEALNGCQSTFTPVVILPAIAVESVVDQ